MKKVLGAFSVFICIAIVVLFVDGLAMALADNDVACVNTGNMLATYNDETNVVQTSDTRIDYYYNTYTSSATSWAAGGYNKRYNPLHGPYFKGYKIKKSVETYSSFTVNATASFPIKAVTASVGAAYTKGDKNTETIDETATANETYVYRTRGKHTKDVTVKRTSASRYKTRDYWFSIFGLKVYGEYGAAKTISTDVASRKKTEYSYPYKYTYGVFVGTPLK